MASVDINASIYSFMATIIIYRRRTTATMIASLFIGITVGVFGGKHRTCWASCNAWPVCTVLFPMDTIRRQTMTACMISDVWCALVRLPFCPAVSSTVDEFTARIGRRRNSLHATNHRWQWLNQLKRYWSHGDLAYAHGRLSNLQTKWNFLALFFNFEFSLSFFCS